MHALVAIDGFPVGYEAVRQAGRLLTPERDEISLYYSPPGADLTSLAADERVHQGRKALSHSVFVEALAELPVGWPQTVGTIIGITDPREGVLQAAENYRSDLIVVGSRGLSRLGQVLLGSVSRSVAHAAQVPVLVVRKPEKSAEAATFRVLLAFENAQSGRRIAAVLGRFQWPEGVSTVSLHVIQNLLEGEIPDWLGVRSQAPDLDAFIKVWTEEHQLRLVAATKAVAEVCRDLPKPLRQAEHCVREGVPHYEIVNLARELECDLIVIGAKGSTPLGRLLVGSTADYVLNHAPCSVLLVRHPA